MPGHKCHWLILIHVASGFANCKLKTIDFPISQLFAIMCQCVYTYIHTHIYVASCRLSTLVFSE